MFKNTLQHTAASCNTQQHAATRVNMLQYVAACCNKLQQAATRCNTLQHAAAPCNTLQHAARRDSKLCYGTLLCEECGKDASDALSLEVSFRKRALYLVALLRK